MPSGQSVIVEARDKVAAAIFGHGWARPCVKLPTLVHVEKVDVPLPLTSLFIGIPVLPSEIRPSQWCNPFTITAGSPAAAYQEYSDWLLRRCDLASFLAPLFGKVLVCCCEARTLCHGSVLVSYCVDFL